MEKSNKQKVRTRLTIGAIIMSAMVWLLFVILAHHSYVMLSEGFINSIGFPVSSKFEYGSINPTSYFGSDCSDAVIYRFNDFQS